MSLQEYKRKRDFQKTAEPDGAALVRSAGHRFVIQKHAASRLHYDFRLELGGTLKSWAVPKGVPYAKGEKRLAVEVEDHPVSYIDFEGTIPQGQYGGGTVMVWDRGVYEPLTQTPEKDLAGGKLHFVLRGRKLNGEWYLVRLREGKQWLLIKGAEDHDPISAKLDDTSAASGKSMHQLSQSDRVWQSNGAPKTAAPPVLASPSRTRITKHKGPKEMAFIEPMKARLVDRPTPGKWLYEIKFDGYRALALKRANDVRLFSRNEKDFNAKFPEIVKAVAEFAGEDAIIDGEIVALDDKGRSAFQLLQAFELNETHPPLFYYVFDLLRLNGEDLTGLPLTQRKALLGKNLKKKESLLRFSASLPGEVKDLLKKVGRLGLEGLIGKRADSVYEAGRRSGAWIKLKLHQEQEMVIGGYTNPGGARQHFGALLLGYYEAKKLTFAGRVGTGFDERMLEDLHARFKKLAAESCPFANLPEKKSSRYGQSLTPGEMKNCHWLQPKLVCQVRFAEWTRDGKLRQPVFLGLREDKSPLEVVRERPAHV